MTNRSEEGREKTEIAEQNLSTFRTEPRKSVFAPPKKQRDIGKIIQDTTIAFLAVLVTAYTVLLIVTSLL